VAGYKSITIGHRSVLAGRKRSCHHDKKHTILKGDACLEVREGMGWKGYCIDCGIVMVDRGVADLTRVRQELVARSAALP